LPCSSSGTWSDRNKAVALLESMSVGRNSKLLTEIREQALEPLIEMALWSEERPRAFRQDSAGKSGGIPEESSADGVEWAGRRDCCGGSQAVTTRTVGSDY